MWTAIILCFVLCFSGVDGSLETLKQTESLFCGQGKFDCPVGDLTTTTTPSGPVGDNGPVFNIQPPLLGDPKCCSSCSCDKSTCHLLDNCCLDALDTLPSVEKSLESLKMSCVLPQQRPEQDGALNAPGHVRMFTVCNKSMNSREEDKAKCERADEFNEFFTNVPVTDKDTGFTYKNKYCAYCHGIPKADNKLVNWTVEIKCDELFYANNFNTIIDDIKATKTCNLIYDVPPDVNKSSCDALISTCNETGLWSTYDEETERACQAFESKYRDKYRNLFCYMCNTDNIFDNEPCIELPKPYAIPSFSAYLVLPTEEIQDTPQPRSETCTADEIYDPVLNHCREIQCKFPKVLKNGECIDYVITLQGSGYDMFFKLIPVTQLPYSGDIFSVFSPLKTALTNLIDELTLDKIRYLEQSISAKVEDLNSDDDVQIDPDPAHSIATTPAISMNTDSTSGSTSVSTSNAGTSSVNEDPYVSYLLAGYRFWFALGISMTSFDNLSAIHGKNITIHDTVQDSELTFLVELVHWFEEPLNPRNVLTGDKMFVLAVEDNSVNKPDIDVYETLTKFHFCPFVSLQLNQTDVELKEHQVKLLPYNYSTSTSSVYISENYTSFIMCLETAKLVFSSFKSISVTPTTMSPSSSTNAVNIVSTVCLMISIVCGFLTFITYVVFKQLRTQPGINTMLLAAYLVLSQFLFFAGFNQAEDVSEESCQALGVLIHYSWLLFLFWMNICTVHMARVFLFHQTTTAKFNICKTTVIYSIYSAFGALIPVLINIIVSITQIEHSNIGYGGSICYVTPSSFHIYIISIPLALIVIANILIYVIVVVQIERTKLKTVKSSSEQRSLFSAYMKMSTITGMTWIFGFVFMFFPEETWAEYLFVLLNATQGVFIFIAFVVNRRVFIMYKQLFNKIKGKSIASSSSNKHLSSSSSRSPHMKNKQSTVDRSIPITESNVTKATEIDLEE